MLTKTHFISRKGELNENQKIVPVLLTLSLCLTPLNILAISEDSTVIEPENKFEDVSSLGMVRIEESQEENKEERSIIVGIIVGETVHLSAKASHYNYHNSYTKIVTRQGKRYEVTYVAKPRTGCFICEYNSY